jgi:MFS family permease
VATQTPAIDRGPVNYPSISRPPPDARILGPWFVAVLFHSYATTLFTVGCYDFADKVLHVSAPTRLWVSAGWGLSYTFIALFSGRLAEKWGARRTMALMMPLCIGAALVGLAMLGVVPGGWWAPALLLAAMTPYNITGSACWPALESVISRSPARMRLSTRMTVYNLSWAIMAFAAVFSRGALEQLWWGLIFVVPAISTVIMVGILRWFSAWAQTPGPETIPETHESETDLDTPALRARAKTLLHMAWIGNALAYVAINCISPVLMLLADSAWVKTGHGIDLALAGVVTSVWGLTRVAGFVIVMRWTGWHYKARWLVGSQLALAGSFCLMLLVHDPWTLILSQIVFGLSTALVYSSSLYYAMHTSEGSGAHAGLHEALIGVGIFIGPAVGAIAGGSAIGMASLVRIGWSVTCTLVIGALVMAIMGVKRKPPGPADEIDAPGEPA